MRSDFRSHSCSRCYWLHGDWLFATDWQRQMAAPVERNDRQIETETRPWGIVMIPFRIKAEFAR